MRRSPFLVCTIAALGASQAQAQLELLRFEGVPGSSQFIAAGVGDIDGDGIADLALGSQSDRTAGPFAGKVDIRSGRDGTVLRTWLGAPYSYLGCSLAGPGDVDRDGTPDVAAGAYTANFAGRTYCGTVTVFSGRTGAVLRQWGGLLSDDWFGFVLDVAGDVNNDGALDLIVGAPQNGNPLGGYEAGYAQVLSPRTGTVLHTFRGTRSGDEFGDAAAGCGDVDRDGYDDLIVGAPLETFLGDRAGCVRVFSGRTGAVLHVFTGRFGSDHFGIGVSGAGDVDVDGVPDLLVGGIDMIYATRTGEARLFSGRDGRLLKVIPGYSNGSMFGRWVGPIGDYDHDGAQDVWVGSPMEMPSGFVRIFSGRTGALLQAIAGDGGGFGAYGRTVGDLDGDHLPELAFGAPMEAGRGAVHVFSSRSTSTYGLGCSTRRQAPELTLSAARIGGRCVVDVDARRARQPMALLVGVRPDVPFALDGECVLYVDPARAFLAATALSGPRGETRFSIPVPADASLIGLELALQAVLGDRTRTELTNGGFLEVGR